MEEKKTSILLSDFIVKNPNIFTGEVCLEMLCKVIKHCENRIAEQSNALVENQTNDQTGKATGLAKADKLPVYNMLVGGVIANNSVLQFVTDFINQRFANANPDEISI